MLLVICCCQSKGFWKRRSGVFANAHDKSCHIWLNETFNEIDEESTEWIPKQTCWCLSTSWSLSVSPSAADITKQAGTYCGLQRSQNNLGKSDHLTSPDRSVTFSRFPSPGPPSSSPTQGFCTRKLDSPHSLRKYSMRRPSIFIKVLLAFLRAVRIIMKYKYDWIKTERFIKTTKIILTDDSNDGNMNVDLTCWWWSVMSLRIASGCIGILSHEGNPFIVPHGTHIKKLKPKLYV